MEHSIVNTQGCVPVPTSSFYTIVNTPACHSPPPRVIIESFRSALRNVDFMVLDIDDEYLLLKTMEKVATDYFRERQESPAAFEYAKLRDAEQIVTEDALEVIVDVVGVVSHEVHPTPSQ